MILVSNIKFLIQHYLYCNILCRRLSDQTMEAHCRDLQLQISQRDDIIDKLRSEIDQIHQQQIASQEAVRIAISFGKNLLRVNLGVH